jgi:hypothetical protein
MRRAEFNDEDGVMHASEPRPGVLLYVVEGRLRTELVQRFIEFAKRSPSEKLCFFHDWWEVDGYDNPARYALTGWSLEHRRQIQSADILTRSRIVKMGVSVGNIALGGLAKLHDSPASFRQALLLATGETTT